jgi:hypothetical protein
MTSDYQSQLQGNQCYADQSNCGTLTTIDALQSSQQFMQQAYYSWPYYVYVPDTRHAKRIAELEGEVKVLREMMAALIGGGTVKPTAKRTKATPKARR